MLLSRPTSVLSQTAAMGSTSTSLSLLISTTYFIYVLIFIALLYHTAILYCGIISHTKCIVAYYIKNWKISIISLGLSFKLAQLAEIYGNLNMGSIRTKNIHTALILPSKMIKHSTILVHHIHSNQKETKLQVPMHTDTHTTTDWLSRFSHL